MEYLKIEIATVENIAQAIKDIQARCRTHLIENPHEVAETVVAQLGRLDKVASALGTDVPSLRATGEFYNTYEGPTTVVTLTSGELTVSRRTPSSGGRSGTVYILMDRPGRPSCKN